MATSKEITSAIHEKIKYVTGDNFPLEKINGQDSFNYYWILIQNAEKILQTEKLDKVKFYFINILQRVNNFDYKIFNAEKSLQRFKKSFFENDFFLSIYLFEENRIISIDSGEKFIKSNEHLIQKDIKKVEIANDENQIEILIHYHGLHGPEKIVLDNYETAVNLRREISNMREIKLPSKVHTKPTN